MEVILIGIVTLLFSLVFHEVSHGYIAYRLGDPTARNAERLTMNPLAHIDPLGTVILPILLAISQSPFFFGWAKPVPFDPSYFKDQRKGIMLVGAAGPASNIFLAVVAIVVFRLFAHRMPDPFILFFYFLCMTNMFLAAFNLIPIPPLDGSRIAAWFMPQHILRKYMKLERFGMLLIILLLLPISAVIGQVQILAEILLGLR